MIHELKINDYISVKPILSKLDLGKHPVINGVIDGNNLGKVYVDCKIRPTAAFIWAKNEMFYLVGNSQNEQFNSVLDDLFRNQIMPDAIEVGEDCLNLELYPHDGWKENLSRIFSTPLKVGERVPFMFRKEKFAQLPPKKDLETGYELNRISEDIIDPEHVIKNEILKFWDSLDRFYQKGIGYCITKDDRVIGTCISVFVSENEYEIGINTYQTEHRGKGFASAMARAFIEECLANGGIPHWTTEYFRKDSIAIAKKLGFQQLPNYNVYFLPFDEFKK